MRAIIAAAALYLAVISPALAAPIDAFVGHWVGRGITESGTLGETVGFVDRELELNIAATADGFTVTWRTLRPADNVPSNKVKNTSISVPFVHVDGDGMYRMAAAGEPLSGAPYIWARVAGTVLEVHSITISDQGVLEYQKYVRTLLSDSEMELRFTRSLDGTIVRTVLARLTRQ